LRSANQEGRYKATWKWESKLPWCKAGLLISRIKWPRTSRLSKKISLSLLRSSSGIPPFERTWHVSTQGPWWGYSNSQFPPGLSTFDNNFPQKRGNGSKNEDGIPPRRAFYGRESGPDSGPGFQPHSGLRRDFHSFPGYNYRERAPSPGTNFVQNSGQDQKCGCISRFRGF